VARIPHTVRRQGVYYFRRAVPAELRHALHRTELCCSLGTRSPQIAPCRSQELYIVSEQLFALLRSRSMLSEAQLAALVQDFYASVLTRENEFRLLLGWAARKRCSQSERGALGGGGSTSSSGPRGEQFRLSEAEYVSAATVRNRRKCHGWPSAPSAARGTFERTSSCPFPALGC
jgi:hypothetical protein